MLVLNNQICIKIMALYILKYILLLQENSCNLQLSSQKFLKIKF
jgi:hypothetical protein